MNWVAKGKVLWYIIKWYYYSRAWTIETVPKGRSTE